MKKEDRATIIQIGILLTLAFAGIIGVAYWARHVNLLKYERFEVQGTVENVEYMPGSFNRSPTTIVTFSDGRVIPFKGNFAVQIGTEVVICHDRHNRFVSISTKRSNAVRFP